jgi:regulator of protease activity HflC (stomatin/prohibitin superfamily)
MDAGGIFISIFGGLLGLVALIIILGGTFFTVEQSTAVIIERFGKFRKVSGAGLNVKVPLIDRVATRIPLRIQQMDVEVETKTKDNVFTAVSLSVQFHVITDSVVDAYYRLSKPTRQIESYVFDVVRAKVPTLALDEVFEKKDDIADAVNEELSDAMAAFGYAIVKALVTDVNPDEDVKKAMNAINAARRNQDAALAQAEAEKIKVVKAAEAEAESKRLQGEGIAAQRKAIADGLKESIEGIREGLGAETSDSAMMLLLTTQHYDAMREIGAKSNTIMLQSGPSAVASITDEIREAIITGDIIAKGAKHSAK